MLQNRSYNKISRFIFLTWIKMKDATLLDIFVLPPDLYGF